MGSFRERVPGDCCCVGWYDWYGDESKTLATNKFVRLPSYWISTEIEDAWNDSTLGIWEITGSIPKSVTHSTNAGYLYTDSGDLPAERTWARVNKFGGDDYYVYYDCIEQEELAKYAVKQSPSGDGPAIDIRVGVTWSWPWWWDYIYGFEAYGGAGGSYGAIYTSESQQKAQRGYINIDQRIIPDLPESYVLNNYFGEFVEHTYLDQEITRFISRFDIRALKTGAITNHTILWQSGDCFIGIDEITYGDTGREDNIGAVPMCVAPRLWPVAAGVRTKDFHGCHNSICDDPWPWIEPDCPEFTTTIETEATVYGGCLGCSSGWPGTLSFPYESEDDVDNEIMEIVPVTTILSRTSSLSGLHSNLIDLSPHYILEVFSYDASPGGYMTEIHQRETTWTGDLYETQDDTNCSFPLDREYEFTVLLIMGSHGAGGTIIDETKSYQLYNYSSLWGKPHAVHKHKSNDPYWLFCVPYRTGDTSHYIPYSVRCYRLSDDPDPLYWETPISTNNGYAPTVKYSSDRWIYVENLHLSSGDAKMVTRGEYDLDEYDQEYTAWLISHNLEDHPESGENFCPYYVPMQAVRNNALDTVNNSRLLPYVPPSLPF